MDYIRDKIQYWLNAGLDPETTDAAVIRSLRNVNIFTLVEICLGLVYISIYWGQSPLHVTALSIAMVLLTFNLYDIHRSKRYERCGFVATLCMFLQIAVTRHAMGGVDHTSYSWILLVPVVGVFLSNIRTGIIWTAICILFTIFLALAETHLGDFSVIVPPEERIGHSVLRISLQLTMILMISISFLVQQNRAERRLRGVIHSMRKEVKARRAAEERALESAKVKSDFLATMSHEIRTPMNGVLGMTQLLLDTEQDEEQQSYTETILSSAEALLVILNDILDFSKIQAGKMTLEERPFDLYSMTVDVARLIHTRARAIGVEIFVRYDPDLPRFLVGDGGRIRQVLMNFVGNALKFTSKGHVLISISSQSQSGSAVDLRIAVEDTGIGISQSAISKLFHSFTQADASTTRRFGGTGLGLAICQRLADLMGGNVGAESEEGHGSVFWMELPLVLDQQNPSGPAVANFEGLSVLIVDNNMTSRLLLKEQLDHWNMETAVAETSSEGLEMLHSNADAGKPFDAAIIHSDVDSGAGLEFGTIVQGNPDLRTTKLVLCSEPGNSKIQNSPNLGFATILTKPLLPDLTRDALCRALDRPNAGSTPEAESALFNPDTGVVVERWQNVHKGKGAA